MQRVTDEKDLPRPKSPDEAEDAKMLLRLMEKRSLDLLVEGELEGACEYIRSILGTLTECFTLEDIIETATDPHLVARHDLSAIAFASSTTDGEATEKDEPHLCLLPDLDRLPVGERFQGWLDAFVRASSESALKLCIDHRDFPQALCILLKTINYLSWLVCRLNEIRDIEIDGRVAQIRAPPTKEKDGRSAVCDCPQVDDLQDPGSTDSVHTELGVFEGEGRSPNTKKTLTATQQPMEARQTTASTRDTEEESVLVQVQTDGGEESVAIQAPVQTVDQETDSVSAQIQPDNVEAEKEKAAALGLGLSRLKKHLSILQACVYTSEAKTREMRGDREGEGAALRMASLFAGESEKPDLIATVHLNLAAHFTAKGLQETALVQAEKAVEAAQDRILSLSTETLAVPRSVPDLSVGCVSDVTDGGGEGGRTSNEMELGLQSAVSLLCVALHNAGVLQAEVGQTEQAVQHFHKALTVADTWLPSEHPLRAVCQETLIKVKTSSLHSPPRPVSTAPGGLLRSALEIGSRQGGGATGGAASTQRGMSGGLSRLETEGEGRRHSASRRSLEDILQERDLIELPQEQMRPATSFSSTHETQPPLPPFSPPLPHRIGIGASGAAPGFRRTDTRRNRRKTIGLPYPYSSVLYEVGRARKVGAAPHPGYRQNRSNQPDRGPRSRSPQQQPDSDTPDRLFEEVEHTDQHLQEEKERPDDQSPVQLRETKPHRVPAAKQPKSDSQSPSGGRKTPLTKPPIRPGGPTETITASHQDNDEEGPLNRRVEAGWGGKGTSPQPYRPTKVSLDMPKGGNSSPIKNVGKGRSKSPSPPFLSSSSSYSHSKNAMEATEADDAETETTTVVLERSSAPTPVSLSCSASFVAVQHRKRKTETTPPDGSVTFFPLSQKPPAPCGGSELRGEESGFRVISGDSQTPEGAFREGETRKEVARDACRERTFTPTPKLSSVSLSSRFVGTGSSCVSLNSQTRGSAAIRGDPCPEKRAVRLLRAARQGVPLRALEDLRLVRNELDPPRLSPPSPSFACNEVGDGKEKEERESEGSQTTPSEAEGECGGDSSLSSPFLSIYETGSYGQCQTTTSIPSGWGGKFPTQDRPPSPRNGFPQTSLPEPAKPVERDLTKRSRPLVVYSSDSAIESDTEFFHLSSGVNSLGPKGAEKSFSFSSSSQQGGNQPSSGQIPFSCSPPVLRGDGLQKRNLTRQPTPPPRECPFGPDELPSSFSDCKANSRSSGFSLSLLKLNSLTEAKSNTQAERTENGLELPQKCPQRSICVFSGADESLTLSPSRSLRGGFSFQGEGGDGDCTLLSDRALFPPSRGQSIMEVSEFTS
uniref:Tetratricopeptide repeat-containing protein n=1 Tax=Chromera velia CCMP2878 TaxID=1169474 RepID=A0A0G4HGU4_9ALVE|eukprot:Cvel_6760.t1-p1 / transcript=Cvel_6760.t1 / gene=Cvel_6760 / organism=Chromera_velia_CCMP2878 / gene_product=hypothetical protein / transcript_product=hypothetical protein / location=Cvel_scaffold339:40810-45613(-) / protein_length=1329 / sequence_SO=supercontig / SO=protein_coding / is_pseudo=false